MPSLSPLATIARRPGRPLLALAVSAAGLALALLLLPFSARAAPSAPAPPLPRCVNVGGTAGCFASIQGAILTATPGTRIGVWPGTYHEHITMTEGIVVEGAGWDQTIIDGDFAAPQAVVNFFYGLTAATVLSGVQVTHGGTGVPAAGGAGILVGAASPRIVNTFVNSNTGNFGGGVTVSGGSPVFDNVAVWYNRGVWGGGVCALSGASALMTGNPFDGFSGTIWFNHADSEGGGMLVTGDSALTLAGLRIWFNDALYGGGVKVTNNDAPLLITLSDISFNSATSGAGLRAETSSQVSLMFDLFTNNQAQYDGGGIALSGVTGTIESNWFLDNRSTARTGAGAYIADSHEGLTLHRNWFERNNAFANGGGLSIFGAGGRPVVDANVIVSNTAGLGGGVYLYSAGNVTVSNNIIARNISTAPGQFGGIQVSQTPARIINNTIADNTGSGISFAASDGLVIVNNIVSGNSAKGISRYFADTAVFTADYNDVFVNAGGNYDNLSPGAHDVSLDPLLAGAGPDIAAFYHLQASSPVAHAGTLAWAPFRDFDGDLRGFGGVSMGADEIAVPLMKLFLPLIRR
jgi:parallel beta-helix repeat protein